MITPTSQKFIFVQHYALRQTEILLSKQFRLTMRIRLLLDANLSQKMLIVTNDEDFLHLSSTKGFPPKVILLRTGNQNRKYIEQLIITNKSQI
ncbi:DUF5615 family PIN-like protein [Limibacterium fermenti]|uniref:DUF5615 family PIN-like protein n=1 Tax=Limibacterium fermenti TaxID=3229863 RepID=UPI003A62BF1E